MNITKEKLRKLAEAATQGRWISQNIRGSGIEMRVPYEGGTRLTFVGVFRALPEEWNKELWANAEYIAAANPTAILSLLDEMGKLQAQVTELTIYRDEFQQMHHRCIDDIKSISTERDKLRLQLAEAQRDAERWEKLCELLDADKATVEFYTGSEVNYSAGLYNEIDAAMKGAAA